MIPLNQKYPSCPICANSNIELALKTNDFSLTKEAFDILFCPICTLQFTNPVPSKDSISVYYNFSDYISHTDVKKGIINKIYHIVRQYTLKLKSNFIQSYFPNRLGKILDIGSGTGAFANTMRMKGWEVDALEPDESSRKIAFDNYGMTLKPIDDFFQLPNNHYDVITLWHVLEHVHDLNDYFVQFNQLLKNDGKLIIAVPNYTCFDANYYKHMWAAYDVPRHLYHFSPQSMSVLCERHNMQIVKYKPMWFDSLYVSLLTEKYINWGIFGILRALIVGVVSNLVAAFDTKKTSSVIYVIQKNTH